MASKIKSDKWLFAGLLVLCLIPILSGIYRLYSINTLGVTDPENLNYLPNPLPIAIHMITFMAFCVGGTFQVAPVFRASHFGLHRLMGRLLLPAGLIAAISGMWMTISYPPLISNGTWIGVVRMIFGAAMVVSLILGALAIKKRDISRHKAWMLRSLALAFGASTQAFVAIFWFSFVGEPQGLPWAFAMTLAWLLNLAVAEFYIRAGDQAFTSTRTRPLT